MDELPETHYYLRSERYKDPKNIANNLPILMLHNLN